MDVASVRRRPLYPPKKQPLNPLNRMVGGAQSRCGRFRRRERSAVRGRLCTAYSTHTALCRQCFCVHRHWQIKSSSFWIWISFKFSWTLSLSTHGGKYLGQLRKACSRTKLFQGVLKKNLLENNHKHHYSLLLKRMQLTCTSWKGSLITDDDGPIVRGKHRSCQKP
jgi:hypothetical protein